jgi:hypothetical protein
MSVQISTLHMLFSMIAAVAECLWQCPETRPPSERTFHAVWRYLWEIRMFPTTFRSVCPQEQMHDNFVEMTQHSPQLSTGRISACLAVPWVTLWKALHDEGQYPYHVKPFQNLKSVVRFETLDDHAPRTMSTYFLHWWITQFSCDGEKSMCNSYL